MPTKKKTEQFADTGRELKTKPAGRHLLNWWKEEVNVLSSDLYIQQPPPYKRAGLDAIYNVLKRHFPDTFFQVNATDQFTISNSNWINYLLVQPKHQGSLGALSELCLVLDYFGQIKIKVPGLELKFNSLINDPQRLRDFLFEIYTYRLLSLNNIIIDINPEFYKQTLEGYCFFDKQKFMFECKKLTVPYLTGLELRFYILDKLRVQIERQKNITGMIGIIKFKNPLDVKMKPVFDNKIRAFWTWFSSQKKERKPLYYKVEDEDGLLEVVAYSQARKIELEYSRSEYHVLFMVIPPFTITPGIENHYRVDVQLHFELSQSKIQKKLENSLNKKRKQHKNHSNRIFFIDSEAINELSLPIFRTNGMFDEPQIQKFYNEQFGLNDILVFVIRDYTTNKTSTKFKVFSNPENERIKKQIEAFKLK
ncbi:MAG: hypothetical protein EYC69_02195 [Bacteroidetes bacterium]|nr:MAG: hypothetical protein EYC69_02195 [Bacteroidota bacterium]